MNGGDLEGLTVISVEQAVAAPFASCRLADAGARVIKVERESGDFARGYDSHVAGQSAYFVWLNRGKESIRLDLRAQADRALLDAMIAAADVFIQNLKPGSLARLGFGAARLRARDPRLITCDVTGFGSSGPRAHLKAYDLIVQAETGLCEITGGPKEAARVGVSIADIAAGMNAHAAILQALFRRERTGAGSAIEVSLFDSMAEWMNVPLLQYRYGGHRVRRVGISHPTIAPYGAYVCRGGERIVLSVQNDREWHILARDVLRRPDIADAADLHTNEQRVARRPWVDGIVAGWVADQAVENVETQLMAAGIAFGRVNGIEEAAGHPHLRFAPTIVGGESINVVAPGARIADHPPIGGVVPEIDEHGDRIRAEFAKTLEP